MPFTPFHMGPGLAIKALAGDRFSLLAFGVAQVAMDIEPLVGMIRGAPVLHGATHTYAAALVIAGIVALVTPPLCRPLLRRWNREVSLAHLPWLASPPLKRVPVIAGAFAGTLSHVALDSLMHHDITPLAPWSNTNSLLDLIPLPALHQACIASGALGLAAWLALRWWRRDRSAGPRSNPPPAP